MANLTSISEKNREKVLSVMARVGERDKLHVLCEKYKDMYKSVSTFTFIYH